MFRRGGPFDRTVCVSKDFVSVRATYISNDQVKHLLAALHLLLQATSVEETPDFVLPKRKSGIQAEGESEVLIGNIARHVLQKMCTVVRGAF